MRRACAPPVHVTHRHDLRIKDNVLRSPICCRFFLLLLSRCGYCCSSAVGTLFSVPVRRPHRRIGPSIGACTCVPHKVSTYIVFYMALARKSARSAYSHRAYEWGFFVRFIHHRRTCFILLLLCCSVGRCAALTAPHNYHKIGEQANYYWRSR